MIDDQGGIQFGAKIKILKKSYFDFMFFVIFNKFEIYKYLTTLVKEFQVGIP